MFHLMKLNVVYSFLVLVQQILAPFTFLATFQKIAENKPVEAFSSSYSIPAARSSTDTWQSLLLRQMASKPSGDRNFAVSGESRRRTRGNDTEQVPQKQPRRREATTGAAPMYITIGPQCCGKSSFLRGFKEGKVKDISLDDQNDVYVPIATEIFLRAYEQNNKDAAINTDDRRILQQVYQGKTLEERIRENIELILILRRWNGDSSPQDFERRIKAYYEERKFSVDVADALVASVESFLLAKPKLPETTDVFVLESLFRPHPETNQSAIQRAHEELRETPKHIPVAWGNTNSKPKDYERALEICHQTRRPVHFILCHPQNSKGSLNTQFELLTLPWVPFDELLKRNLHRLQEQGRFVPANAIADCSRRVEGMIPATFFGVNSDTIGYKNVEEHLVSIASPSHDQSRWPRRKDNRRQNHPPPYRYILTKHRLIQKQYPRNNAGPSSQYRRQNKIRHNQTEGRGPR